MSNNEFRPRFKGDKEYLDKWRKAINKCKELGVDELLIRLNDDYHKVKQVETEKTLSVDAISSKVRTIKELIDYHKINTDTWTPDRVTTNYWEMGAKLPDGTVVTTPLHQIKASFKRKESEVTFEELKEELIQAIEDVTHIPKKYNYPNVFKEVYTEGVVPELMISDFHLGKIARNYKTNEYYWDLEEAKRTYLQAIDSVLWEIETIGMKVNHFIFPTGNDFLNIDNSKNETTKGTPQMTGIFWKQLFRFGSEMIITAVNRLLDVAPVKIVMVEGNHDKDSVFTLGEVLMAYYRNYDNVEINNSYSKRKYHSFGNVLLGYFHFNEAKPNKAHNSIISDVPELAHKKFKCIHGGHYHKNMKSYDKAVTIKDENYGIEVEICPSLCPTDEWHHNNLYIGNLRRTKTFIWHPDKGLIKELYFNL